MEWLRSLTRGSRRACTHVPESLPDPTGSRCEECNSTYNLRMCATCGHVGCCESQRGHARAHALGEDHPVIIAMPIDRGFTWCYVEDTYVR